MSSLGRCSRNASAARLRGATHPAKLVVGGLVKLVDEADLDAACIFVVAPSTVIHARYLCVKLRAQLPNLKIAIGLWSATENITQAAERLRDSGANEVVTTIADAVEQLAIIMQILHNEAEAYDNLLQEVFFHPGLALPQSDPTPKENFQR
jgi:hypothetical protein